MSRIKKTFVRLSRSFIAHFLTQYPVLYNLVDARYVSSIAWLKSCGAEFGDFVDINGNPFLPFVIRRS